VLGGGGWVKRGLWFFVVEAAEPGWGLTLGGDFAKMARLVETVEEGR